MSLSFFYISKTIRLTLSVYYYSGHDETETTSLRNWRCGGCEQVSLCLFLRSLPASSSSSSSSAPILQWNEFRGCMSSRYSTAQQKFQYTPLYTRMLLAVVQDIPPPPFPSPQHHQNSTRDWNGASKRTCTGRTNKLPPLTPWKYGSSSLDYSMIFVTYRLTFSLLFVC